MEFIMQNPWAFTVIVVFAMVTGYLILDNILSNKTGRIKMVTDHVERLQRNEHLQENARNKHEND